MASIYERTYKNGKKNYWLREKIDGKTVLTYLGTKPPLPKGISTKGLSLDWVGRLKSRAAKRAKPKPQNSKLPEGQFAVIYADPPWQYDFVQVNDWGVDAHYETLPLEGIKNYKDEQGGP